MNKFKATLENYLAGRAEFAQLDASLKEALREDPAAGQGAAAEIDRLHESGRLSLEDCSLLRHSIAMSQSPAPHASDAARSQADADADDGNGVSDPTELADGSGSPAQAVDTGSILNGRFVLENVVGRGGMGLVFKARDLRKEEAEDRDPYVAIKILNDDFRRHAESLRTLQRESRKSQSLAHPNIVTVYDFDRDGDTVYMTMEFLKGEPLDRMTKSDAFEGMRLDEAYPLIEGMSRALSYAHAKGVVHSDFKPGNCFLTSDGGIKVFDFGIARAAKLPDEEPADATRFDAGKLGALTPAYASWEMLQGAEPDPRDDVYGLACVTYELLTGRHPFDMHSAAEARLKKLVPRRIKGLRPAQWRTLEEALAFDRDQRCPDVDSFLTGFTERTGKKAWAAAGLAATVLVVAGAALLIPEYLQQRRIESSVAALTSGQDDNIAAALAEYETYDAAMQGSVMQQAGDRLLDYFLDKIAAAVDSARGRYDYPEAERWLAVAETYFEDSAILLGWANTLQNGKRALLAELDSRFNDHLSAGRLLLTPEDNVTEVLRILAEVEPGHALLDDPRLAAAFTDEAARALLNENFTRAGQLIEAGLARFQGDARSVAALMDIQDRLINARQSQDVSNRVAQLRAELAAFAEMQTLTELRSLEGPVTVLASLAPGDALVSAYRESLATIVDAELAPLLAARRWDDAEILIDDVSHLLTGEQLRATEQQLTEARFGFEGEQGTVLAALNEAIDEGRMDVALLSLAELRALGVDGATMEQARATIEQGFVRAALDARVDGDLDRAAEIVEAGLRFDPESAELLNVESGIVEYRRFLESANEAAAAARDTQIMFYRDRIPELLAPAELGIEEARQVLDDMSRLANLEPGNPLARDGRGNVADKLANGATALSIEGRWDEAVALTDEAIVLVGESRRLWELSAELKAGRDRHLADEREAEIEQQRARLLTLLESPDVDDAWNAELNNVLSDLERVLPEDDMAVADVRTQVAERYTALAIDMRQQGRFSEAGRMLEIGSGYASDLEAIFVERDALAVAERVAQAENEERARVARIEGLRQSVLAAANAHDLAGARENLEKLRDELPPADPFLVTTAPEAFGVAYRRLAQERYDRDDFDGAGETARQGLTELAELGLTESPTTTVLRELLNDIPPARLALNLRSLEEILDDGRPADVDTPKALLSAIEQDAGTMAFTEHEADLVALVEQRIDAANDPQPIRDWASQIFEREFVAPLDNSGQECTVELAGKGLRVTGRQPEDCWDVVDARAHVRGPTLVVIPRGGFVSVPFAIGKYEVSVGEWNMYCRLSTNCEERAGDGALPVTNIGLAEARNYASWLSRQTDALYRLPTSAEWQYAASAPRAQHDDNCAVRGGTPRDVSVGRANGWGMKNYVGNAQEWVTSPLGPEVRGGSYRGDLSLCTVESGERHSGAGDEETGFRLVRELPETA